METELTKKDKNYIKKVAPAMAGVMFGEDQSEDRDFVYELAIRSAIRSASANGEHYLGLKKIAQAIKDGIGDDLSNLIKLLK